MILEKDTPINTMGWLRGEVLRKKAKTKWTSIPENPGWYWYRKDINSEPSIIQIKEKDTVMEGYEWYHIELPPK